MGNGRSKRLGLLLCVVLSIVTGCSVDRAVAGRATIPPLPPHGTVNVTMALTDSFDVLPDGKCAGRDVNGEVRDGASVDIAGMSFEGKGWSKSLVGKATISTSYDPDDFSRRPEDDGKYCLAHFAFVPTKPDPQGYNFWMPSGFMMPQDSFRSVPPGGRGYGDFAFVVQTCTDMDAPPERTCGRQQVP